MYDLAKSWETMQNDAKRKCSTKKHASSSCRHQAEPRVTLPVVHSCHCSTPVRHHHCFLPPLLRFCPGFWRSHVLCLQNGEVIWSDTLGQTPWRSTFDVRERLGIGDADQNMPRSLIIQQIHVNSCQFQTLICVLNRTIHSAPPNQRPLQLLNVACQQPVVQFSQRAEKTTTKCPWTSLNYLDKSTQYHTINHWHIDMQTHLYIKWISKNTTHVNKRKLFNPKVEALSTSVSSFPHEALLSRTSDHPVSNLLAPSAVPDLFVVEVVVVFFNFDIRRRINPICLWCANTLDLCCQHAWKVCIDMFFQCPNLNLLSLTLNCSIFHRSATPSFLLATKYL